MTTTESISNRLSRTDIIGSTPGFAQVTPNANSCRFELTDLVRAIESPAIRDVVSVVFADLLRLLECLDLIEVHLRKVESAEQTFALFQLIHDEAGALVDFIHTEGLKLDGLTEELFDTLDGISFAVNHDLQRVFETNSKPLRSSNKSHAVVGRLYRAHDLLTNCLQQSTITLAMVFDPELDGTRLFNNSDMRFRQSLQLCDDLAELIQLVAASEENQKETNLESLGEGIQKFRNESMELLMYSDWPQFESACEQIDPQRDPQQLAAVLHQFRCYLETLLGQVRMRAVLANVFPLGFGDDHFSSPKAQTAQPVSAERDWNHLALAV